MWLWPQAAHQMVCPGPAKRSLCAVGCAFGPNTQGAHHNFSQVLGGGKLPAVMCPHCHVSDTKGCGQGRGTRGSLCDAPPRFRSKNCKVNSLEPAEQPPGAWRRTAWVVGGWSQSPSSRSVPDGPRPSSPGNTAGRLSSWPQAPLSCALALHGLRWRWGLVPRGAGHGSSVWDGLCLPVSHSASS